MTNTQTEKTPLARLVLFMIFLSVAGGIIAGVYYYAVDLPAQNALEVPTNEPHWDQDCIKLCETEGPPPDFYCFTVRHCFHD